MTPPAPATTRQTERQLVNAAMGGDHDAFAVLVQRYERAVIAAATAALGDRHAAQDVAQDAFVIAYEKLASLRQGASFGAWILQITRRRAWRVANSRPKLQTLNEHTTPAEPRQNGQLDPESQQLLQLIEKLPQHESLVVMLKYFDRRSAGDIAEMTGQTVGTVTKKLTRARERLRNWLEENE